MTNVKIVPAIAILTVISVMLFIAFSVESGEAEETEPNDVYAGKIDIDPPAQWAFQGTFCAGCNILYNYIEHPKICDKCDEQTKDYFNLVLIKDRN